MATFCPVRGRALFALRRVDPVHSESWARSGLWSSSGPGLRVPSHTQTDLPHALYYLLLALSFYPGCYNVSRQCFGWAHISHVWGSNKPRDEGHVNQRTSGTT